MRFLSLSVKAARGFREPFTLPLANQGLVLVEGENRDGGTALDRNAAYKSWLFETILWILYEKLARHGNKRITTEMVHPERGAEGTIEFERGGTVFRATRHRNTRGASSFQIRDPQGEPIKLSRDRARAVGDISGAVGLDYAACLAAVVVAEGKNEAETFATQMSTLEALLRLDELSGAQELAAARLRELDLEIARYASQVQLREGEVQSATADEVAASQAQDVSGDIATAEQAIAQGEFALQRLPGLRVVVSDIQGTLRAIRSKQASAQAEVAKVDLQIHQTRASQRDAVCPTCLRPLQEAEKYEELKQREASLLLDRVQRLKVKDKLDGELFTAEQKAVGFANELAKLEAEAAGLSEWRSHLATLLQADAERTERLKAATRRREEAERALTELTATVAELEARRFRAWVWARGFGRDEIQAETFAAALPVLNDAAADYAQRLTNGLIQVQFRTLRGSRTDDILVITGASAPTYDGCSSGEKQRIRLIRALSFRALARSRLPEPINLAVFDEVFDHIDPAGLQTVAQILQEELEVSGTIFVVTHSPALKAIFPGAKVLKVIREGGESTVHYA